MSKAENSAYEEVVGRSPDGDGGHTWLRGFFRVRLAGPMMGEPIDADIATVL